MKLIFTQFIIVIKQLFYNIALHVDKRILKKYIFIEEVTAMYKEISMMFGILTYYFLAYSALYIASYKVMNALAK